MNISIKILKVSRFYKSQSVEKNYIILEKWGLGRSPKRGEGGSPTLSPFPGERGLGIGVDDKHFCLKNILFLQTAAEKLLLFRRISISESSDERKCLCGCLRAFTHSRFYIPVNKIACYKACLIAVAATGGICYFGYLGGGAMISRAF